MDCEKETSTQHKWGQKYGHGPIQDDEVLLVAVFENDAYDKTLNRLKYNFFRREKLKNFDVSLARQRYISKRSFERDVVKPRSERGDVFVGVVEALAGEIRKITFVEKNHRPIITGRGFCMLDIVEPPEDHESHAALGYSEKQEPLSKNQKNAVRQGIDADLVDAFSPVKMIGLIGFGTDSKKGKYRRIAARAKKRGAAKLKQLKLKFLGLVRRA